MVSGGQNLFGKKKGIKMETFSYFAKFLTSSSRTGFESLLSPQGVLKPTLSIDTQVTQSLLCKSHFIRKKKKIMPFPVKS